jgi:Fe-S-cluster containining protein
MSLPTCCTDIDLDPFDLAFPKSISRDGREFFEAHGLYDLTVRELFKNAVNMRNGNIKIRHRCNQLQDDGRCKIYEARPLVCRQFNCRTRKDCACHGMGIINANQF